MTNLNAHVVLVVCRLFRSDIIACVVATLYGHAPVHVRSYVGSGCFWESCHAHGFLVSHWMGGNRWLANGGLVRWQGVEMCAQSACCQFLLSGWVGHFFPPPGCFEVVIVCIVEMAYCFSVQPLLGCHESSVCRLTHVTQPEMRISQDNIACLMFLKTWVWKRQGC